MLHLLTSQPTIPAVFNENLLLCLLDWLDSMRCEYDVQYNSVSCFHQALGKPKPVLGLPRQDVPVDRNYITPVQR